MNNWRFPYRHRSAPVLIVTPVADEFEAVQKAADAAGYRSVESKPPLPDYLRCDVWAKGLDGGASTSALIIVSPDRIGKLEAAIAVTTAIHVFTPSLVVLCGIAGAFKSSLGNGPILGDIIIADEVLDYDLRKINDPLLPDIRPSSYTTKQCLLDLATRKRNLSDRSRGWLSHLTSTHRGEYDPRVFIGPILSSNTVLASDLSSSGSGGIEDYFPRQNAADIHSNSNFRIPIAIEMEGAAIGLAVSRLVDHGSFMIIKGISDFADQRKSVDQSMARSLARHGAAAFAVEMAQSYARHSRELAG